MPTAGRLAGAFAFALLGWYLTTAATAYFPEGSIPGYWTVLGVLSGVFAGWVVVGKRTGHGLSAGIGNGITGVITLVFWVIFIVSFVDMIKKSLRKSYDGPVEAVVDVFALAYDYLLQFAQQDLAIIVVVGGVAAGLFAEYFGKRYS